MTTAVFLVGLIVRVIMLSYRGVADTNEYREWGERVLTKGLAEAFSGMYYPLQYQLFAAAAWFDGVGGRSAFYWLKGLNLLGDIGIFFLLVRNADEAHRTQVAALYWLNPWFIAVACLGYCDFQFSVFLLLFCVLLNRGTDLKSCFIAGIPLALAFMMKPQVMVVVMALGILCAVSLVLRRPAWDAVVAMIPSVLLFAGYSLYFLFGGQPLLSLTRAYLVISDVLPSTTAHMLNIWYPIATLAKPHGHDYALRDTVALLGVPIRSIAVGLTLGSLAWFAVAISWYEGESRPRRIVPLVAAATVVLPMIMTGAHENHLFFGTIGLCLLLGLGPTSKWIWAAVLTMMALQAINIVGWYGLGRNSLSSITQLQTLNAFWHNHPWVRTSAALLDVAAFLAVVTHLTSRVAPSLRRAWIPAAVLAAVLIVLYAAAVRDRSRLEASPAVARWLDPSRERARVSYRAADRRRRTECARRRTGLPRRASRFASSATRCLAGRRNVVA